MQLKLLKLAGLLFGTTLLLTAQAQPSQYKFANRFAVAGDGGWDYIAVDEASARLFVSHATVVQVVDEISGTLLGTIADTKGVHGIALAPELNKGFTSNGKEDMLTVFDLKTLAVLGKVATTGKNPDAIVYDSCSKQIFAFNGKSANATILDAKTLQLTATLDLPGKPEFAVVDGKGNLYVNIEDKNLLCHINTKTRTVEHSWSVAPGAEPSGLALDVAGQRLFAVCGNKLMIVMNAKTGKVITTLPIGERVDGVAFDPVLKRAYSSNGDGTLTVVQEETPDTFTVLENVPTQKGARTVVVDSRTHHIFLPTATLGATPEPTANTPRPRPTLKPGSFVILDVAPVPQ